MIILKKQINNLLIKYDYEKKVLILIVLLSLAVASFVAMMIDWKAWRYEDRIIKEFFNPNLSLNYIEKKTQELDPSILEQYYLGDTLFTSRTMAHNETTEAGKPPYNIIIIVRMPEVSNIDKIIFHNITLISSLGQAHEFNPTEKNKKGEPTTALSFPVTIKSDEFDPHPRYVEWFSLWSLFDLNFNPKSGETIDIQIDAEIFKGDESERKILKHTIEPRLESGSRIFFLPKLFFHLL